MAGMPPRRRSNPLSLAVLACLVERPMHPYEMGTTMRTRGQDQSIKLNYGSLYTVVEALARAGLIDAQETARAGKRPERTVYAITEAGRREFVDWLSELLRTPMKEWPQYEAGLLISMLNRLPIGIRPLILIQDSSEMGQTAPSYRAESVVSRPLTERAIENAIRKVAERTEIDL